MTLRNEMITVFGASGFIGRYVVRELAKAGYRVRAATRRPHLAHELKPMGVVGQVQLMQANLRNEKSSPGVDCSKSGHGGLATDEKRVPGAGGFNSRF